MRYLIAVEYKRPAELELLRKMLSQVGLTPLEIRNEHGAALVCGESKNALWDLIEQIRSAIAGKMTR